MPTKQYIKKLNGYYVKDEDARNRVEEVDDRVDTTNERIDSMDYGTLKFHSVAASKATYVVEAPNGKNVLIDTGLSNAWSDIKTAIDGLGITKFDYAILTHFHTDHIGNVQNFVNNYDMTNCVWYVQMKPDFTNHASDIDGTEADYDNVIAALEALGIQPIVPTNDSYVTIDQENDVQLHFLNTDATIAENYYGRYGEWLESLKVNFNVFSLITEIIHHDVKILSTGDIERPVEEQFAKKLGKVNIVTAPHHGTNRDACREFYAAIMPDYTICADPDLTGTGMRSYLRSRFLLEKFGSQIISPTNSQDVDGLFSFESDGNKVTSRVLGGALTDSIFNFNHQYQEIGGLVNWTSQDDATITLEQLIANLPEGYEMSQIMDGGTKTAFAQVVADLETVFPAVALSAYLNIRKSRVIQEITSYDTIRKFTATRNAYPGQTPSAWKLKGEGVFTGTISGKDALITRLNSLPIGHYMIAGYKESDSTVLATSDTYQLVVDVLSHDTTVEAKVSAILRDDSTDVSRIGDRAITAELIYKSSTSPAVLSWRKTS